MTLLNAALDDSRDHDNSARVSLPHHAPERPRCLLGRALRGNVLSERAVVPSNVVGVDVPEGGGGGGRVVCV
jgi:hypothetical protein